MQKIENKKKKRFTVVTVCRNSETVIRNTIESVLMQTYPNIEYIIVDGKSLDKTAVIAESYKSCFMQKGYLYRVISEPDHGIYDAMNKGIGAASGQVIGFINAGDWYEKNAVSIASRAFENTFYDYFFGDIHIVRADGRVMTKHAKADCFPSSRHWNHPSGFVKKQYMRSWEVLNVPGFMTILSFICASGVPERKS